MTSAPTVFDVCGALPTGTTVLEAGAGTGKTFTIAALAVRYIAEGHAELPELMLVTFGREATQELRERVRERLVSAEHGLADPVAARAGDDEVLALLARAAPEEVALRRRRVARAVAHFDAATIATTHQFCQQMLAGLGVLGDADPDAVFTESIDDLVTEVVDDFYVRKYAGGTGRPAFDRAVGLSLARRSVGDPQARLEPADADPGTAAHVRYSFAVAVRAEVERRKRARGLFSYEDMLTRLRDALVDPARGPAACARLRGRYRVVLVDEFQDTDPIQWEILERAFHGHAVLVLIGDPKQAIYAFRGADVVSYLHAVDEADAHATLGRNYRSDAPLLSALDTVWGGAALGDERIVVHRVRSAHEGRRLAGAPVDTPLRLRVVGCDRLSVPPSKKLATVGAARPVVAADVAADLAALLAGPARLSRPGAGATDDGRPLRPGDVAVLVRTNVQGVLVRDACVAAGVPAVLTGTASMFATPVAREWLTLLEAVEQPQRAGRVRSAALTCFLGHTVEQLCGPSADEVLDELGALLRRWSRLLVERGVAALQEAVTTRTRLIERLLAATGGERVLTDLRHIGQALHHAAVEGHLGPAALVEWLRHRRADAAADTGPERSRRLESDTDAVQIVTVHRSKGLEFPVVYVPFGWDRWVPGDLEFALLHDDDGHRVLDVGGATGGGWKQRCDAHRTEEGGEDLRLLYVALTRACCQVVIWWAPTTNTPASALHRLLLGRPEPGTAPTESYRVPDDAEVLALLRRLESPELVVEPLPATAPPAPRAGHPGIATAPLRVAAFERNIDTGWRRTSYSGLTADAHATHAAGSTHSPGMAGEPEESGTGDEPADGADIVAPARDRDSPTAPPTRAVPSPMAELPVGAEFGTLVHAVFETVDTTAPDLLGELTACARRELDRGTALGLDPVVLAAALVPVVETPLGPLAGDRRLRDVGRADRLAELDFELPLAGGDAARRGEGPQLTLGALAPVLCRRLTPGDPLRGYPDLLASPALAGQPLRGYLTGSIDAVLRVDGRFVVVDYKTNWLGPTGPTGRDPLTSAHYVPGALAGAMAAAHYPLQALLYSVALHRFLRWRLSGYEPQAHLGGVLYLFLRGMCGPDTPVVDGTPCGVFGWAPPAVLVVELSRLLDEGVS